MDAVAYYKCEKCGYEFLSKTAKPVCPHCGTGELERKDIRTLSEFSE